LLLLVIAGGICDAADDGIITVSSLFKNTIAIMWSTINLMLSLLQRQKKRLKKMREVRIVEELPKRGYAKMEGGQSVVLAKCIKDMIITYFRSSVISFYLLRFSKVCTRI